MLLISLCLTFFRLGQICRFIHLHYAVYVRVIAFDQFFKRFLCLFQKLPRLFCFFGFHCLAAFLKKLFIVSVYAVFHVILLFLILELLHVLRTQAECLHIFLDGLKVF